MSKKLIFLALFLTLTFPLVAPAQTFSVEQQAQIQSIIQQITDLQIQILLARIEELKAQIVELLTQQTIMAKKVETIVEGTVTPIVTPPAPPKVIPAVPIITVGNPYCDGQKVFLPINIEGNWKEALVRVFSEPSGGLDIKMILHPNDKDFAFGSKADLKAETSGYGNPADNPFLNGSTFKYEVKVYDSEAQAQGSLTLPVCE